MSKEITTEELQLKIYNIAKSFVDYVQEDKSFEENNIELKLILNKINSNLQKSAWLWSKAAFNEAYIILRSAFESLVLFEYLVYEPDALTKYKNDNILCEFQNLLGFYNRGYSSKQQLILAFNDLDVEIRKSIPFEETTKSGLIIYNEEKLNKFFCGGRNGFKPLSQQVTYMINRLREIKSINANRIYEYQIIIYNIGSQITHTRFDSLIKGIKQLNQQETLEEIKWCSRHSVFILRTIVSVLVNKFQYQNPEELWQKIILLLDYLQINIDKSNIPNEEKMTELIYSI